jgi:hypothetical protein
MPRLLITLVIAASLAVALALQAAWSSSAATGPGTIRITSRQESLRYVDVGRPGRGPGDMQIIRQNVFNKRIRAKPLGNAEMVCTFVTARIRSCMATVFLPKGKLVAGGTIRYSELYDLAVLGGTRLYDNARGTLTVIRTTRRPRREILLFRLAG